VGLATIYSQSSEYSEYSWCGVRPHLRSFGGGRTAGSFRAPPANPQAGPFTRKTRKGSERAWGGRCVNRSRHP
jgi:hypothetical protein